MNLYGLIVSASDAVTKRFTIYVESESENSDSDEENK